MRDSEKPTWQTVGQFTCILDFCRSRLHLFPPLFVSTYLDGGYSYPMHSDPHWNDAPDMRHWWRRGYGCRHYMRHTCIIVCLIDGCLHVCLFFNQVGLFPISPICVQLLEKMPLKQNNVMYITKQQYRINNVSYVFMIKKTTTTVHIMYV